MRSAPTRVGLRDDAVIYLIGSNANGSAQIRTLAATDNGFDRLKNPKAAASPDVDAMLYSRLPLDYELGQTYRAELDTLLAENHLRSCGVYNIGDYGYNLQGEFRKMNSSYIDDTAPNLFKVFTPGYP